ncbi:MAG: hypothetical protein ACI9FD_004150, partial [Gammaproteobacteria bacterium]
SADKAMNPAEAVAASVFFNEKLMIIYSPRLIDLVIIDVSLL